MTCLKMANSLLLHPVLLSLTTRVRWYTCAHVCPLARSCRWKEDPMEKILLTIFLWREVKGRRVISIATGADDSIVPIATKDHINHTQNFSPTSPTILHVDHLINPQQYPIQMCLIACCSTILLALATVVPTSTLLLVPGWSSEEDYVDISFCEGN
jgi:hypothetical protein